MADLNELRRLIQYKIQNTDSEYLPVVDASILSAWSIFAKSYRWHFLRAGKPYEISTVANQPLYTLEQKEIGHFLDITNSDGLTIWEYKDTEDFAEKLRTTGGDLTNSPAFFTDLGKVSGNIQIQLYPVPLTVQTGYLHYYEEGSLANIDKAPSSCIKVLTHGAMSCIAPPKKMDVGKKSFWEAVTTKEDDMFIKWINIMINDEQIKKVIRPDYLIDKLTTDRIEGVNEL